MRKITSLTDSPTLHLWKIHPMISDLRLQVTLMLKNPSTTHMLKISRLKYVNWKDSKTTWTKKKT